MRVTPMLAACVAGVMMLGCTSLNVTNIVHTVSVSTTQTRTEYHDLDIEIPLPPPLIAPSVGQAASLAQVPEKAADGSAVVCPVYRPLPLRPIPRLPIKEIEAAGPGNPEKVREIERKHIEDLRLFILQGRLQVQAHQAAYLSKCKAHQPK